MQVLNVQTFTEPRHTVDAGMARRCDMPGGLVSGAAAGTGAAAEAGEAPAAGGAAGEASAAAPGPEEGVPPAALLGLVGLLADGE